VKGKSSRNSIGRETAEIERQWYRRPRSWLLINDGIVRMAIIINL